MRVLAHVDERAPQTGEKKVKTSSNFVRAGAVLLVAATMLGGCVVQPTPGYGYYGTAPVAGAVYVGGGWGGWGGHYGWHRGGYWRR